MIDPDTESGRPGGRAAPTLCSPFVEALAVDGASVSVFGLSGHQLTICTSDPVAARAEALQFELGEGPHWDVLRTGVPVLCPDLATSDPVSWPVFANAARKLDIAAVFAFPMTIGAATIGVVDLYSRNPRRLDAHQVSLASSMASRIATTAVRRATAIANQTDAVESPMAPALRREVHQATGIIQAQLNISATDAFARLRAHAFSTGQHVDRVSEDVVGRHLDFRTILDQ